MCGVIQFEFHLQVSARCLSIHCVHRLSSKPKGGESETWRTKHNFPQSELHSHLTRQAWIRRIPSIFPLLSHMGDTMLIYGKHSRPFRPSSFCASGFPHIH